MNSNKVPYFFLGLAAVLSAVAIALLIFKPGAKKAAPQVPQKELQESAAAAEPKIIEGTDEPMVPETSEEILKNLDIGYASADPSDLLNRIGKALEEGDMSIASKLIGKGALDEESLARLIELSKEGPLKLLQPGAVREVGELELNRLARWSIQLEDRESGRDRIFFDLRREGGKWMVDKMTLPPATDQEIPKAPFADSLGVSDAFLQAVLQQDFEFALSFVDLNSVSETKIAALCILFEEGEYKMRSSKPLRAMFSRRDTVGYIANVETKDGTQSAQFSLNLRQPEGKSNWIVSEINLDELLAEYSSRVAGGDVYYSPLVENPSGGETLALYFDFDEDSMSPRTRRQLEIVASMLKSDAAKKITLSGHTDALGTDNYNNQLSASRARVVRDFLANAGVAEEQIITVAKGASQPRRPNVTESGEDDPEGRRANRRTEIYLDF
ncbi:OmpA family protein [Luteolibacter algae]|uniref:OmpA family protein n=1 Tax=Luteolibacter algae TaxID=454151 RepID=A0ABW5D434_9BACT